MPQTIKTLENIIKDVYLPLWNNQLTTDPSAFFAKIKKVPLAGDKITAAAKVGLSGGFGFGEEGKATPKSGRQKFERFTTNAKDMYVDVSISVKATKLTGEKGAMADALHTEIESAYETAKWNIGRSIFGNGTGILANVTSVSGHTATVDDTKFFKEGITVDFYAKDATTEDAPTVTGRIVSVDRASGKITLDTELTEVPSDSFVTVQNSYGREITGLGSIFDDSVTHLYGVSKETNPVIKPTVINCNQDISDTLLVKGLRQSKNYKNGDINMLLCGDEAYDAYVEYLRTSNIRVESTTGDIEGGWKAIKYLFGNKEVLIVNEEFVSPGEILGVNTDDFEFHSVDWAFADLQGSGIFNLKENQSVYRALLTNYGDLICKNPGACVRYINIGTADIFE